jgi:hypothetical protein
LAKKRKKGYQKNETDFVKNKKVATMLLAATPPIIFFAFSGRP